MKSLLLCIMTVISSASSACAAEATWHLYVNPRFGVGVEYPSIFSVRDPPPDNGDGQVFRTTQGDATLRVYGSYNTDNSSAAQLMQSYKAAGTKYSYSKATKDWFVLSGTKDGQISYVRCNLGGSEVVGCAELDYPATELGKWAAVVGRVSKSLRVNTVHH